MSFNQTGSDGTTVEFVSVPSDVEAGETGELRFEVQLGDPGSGDHDADVMAALYVNGTNTQSIVATQNATATDNDIVQGTFSHVFRTNSSRNEDIAGQNRLSALSGFEESSQSQFNSYPRTDEPIWVEVEVDYYGVPGYAQGTVDEVASTGAESVQVTRPVDDPQIEQFGDAAGVAGDNTLAGTFQGRTPFSIGEIEYEDDATYVGSIYTESEINDGLYEITFEDFPNPTVSIDTAGRFAKHEILGGTTVRQKIGEDPINISVNGICKRRAANQIDSLRDATSGKLFSDRLPGNNDALRVQFGSTSTEPMTDGGAADLKDGEYLYSYTINAIEVIR